MEQLSPEQERLAQLLQTMDRGSDANDLHPIGPAYSGYGVGQAFHTNSGDYEFYPLTGVIRFRPHQGDWQLLAYPG